MIEKDLAFVAARGHLNRTLVTAFGLKVSFSVAPKEPAEVQATETAKEPSAQRGSG